MFNGLPTTDVNDRGVEAVPAATQRLDATTAAAPSTSSPISAGAPAVSQPPAQPAVQPPSDTVSRSVSSGRLTSSSSDDVTAADRKSSSVLAAVTNTLKRALRRHTSASGADLAGGAHLARDSPTTSGQKAQGTRDEPSRHAEHVPPVTSRTPSDVIALVLSGGGKVTYF